MAQEHKDQQTGMSRSGQEEQKTVQGTGGTGANPGEIPQRPDADGAGAHTSEGAGGTSENDEAGYPSDTRHDVEGEHFEEQDDQTRQRNNDTARTNPDSPNAGKDPAHGRGL